MEYTVSDDSGARIVHLSGPIDVSSSLELRDLLGGLVGTPGARVLLDLSGTTLIDSSGVGILVTAHRMAATAGSAFTIAGAPGPVGRVFELTRTDRLLRIFPSVAEGLAALRA